MGKALRKQYVYCVHLESIVHDMHIVRYYNKMVEGYVGVLDDDLAERVSTKSMGRKLGQRVRVCAAQAGRHGRAGEAVNGKGERWNGTYGGEPTSQR